jgi:hypothetical protein
VGEPLKNVGRNDQVFVYVDGTKLNRDFKNITKVNVAPEYYEGNDEHLGRSPVRPWQLFKLAKITFDFEEDNASNVHAIIQGIDVQALNGVRATIQVVVFTQNNDGTTSKATYSDGVLKFNRTNSGKGDKISYSCEGTFGTRDLA